MISVEELKKSFNDQVVLDNISFTIKPGEVVAIIGSSGAGKSTLLRSLNFLDKADSGRLMIDQFTVDFTNLSKKDLLTLRQLTGMVFQQFNLFKGRTVLENVMEGLLIVKKIPKAEAMESARAHLAAVGLLEKEQAYPKHLSGGQQQRVGIARALAMQPTLLLLDEPTSALDPELVGEVLSTIKATVALGQTMLLVSHEMNFVYEVADRVLFLDKGKIIEEGSPDEVFNHPKAERTKQFLSNYYRGQKIQVETIYNEIIE